MIGPLRYNKSLREYSNMFSQIWKEHGEEYSKGIMFCIYSFAGESYKCIYCYSVCIVNVCIRQNVGKSLRRKAICLGLAILNLESAVGRGEQKEVMWSRLNNLKERYGRIISEPGWDKIRPYVFLEQIRRRRS